MLGPEIVFQNISFVMLSNCQMCVQRAVHCSGGDQSTASNFHILLSTVRNKIISTAVDIDAPNEYNSACYFLTSTQICGLPVAVGGFTYDRPVVLGTDRLVSSTTGVACSWFQVFTVPFLWL